MKQVVVIYNPASICSVLAAAHYIDNRRKFMQEASSYKAYPAGNKIPQGADLNVWIGVEPSISLVAQMPGEHNGYFTNRERSKSLQKVMTVYYHDSIGTNDPWYESSQMLPDSVFKAVLNYNVELLVDKESGRQLKWVPQWYIAKIAAEYETGQWLTLEDQALVWVNYRDSLHYLSELCKVYVFTRYPYTPSPRGNLICHQPTVVSEILAGSVREYKDELRSVKQQLTMIFETSVIAIGGESKIIPLINVPQTMAPLVLRLLSQTYDYGVTYIQRRGVNVYTAFSRIAGFDDVILKAVNSGSQKPQAMMSYQL